MDPGVENPYPLPKPALIAKRDFPKGLEFLELLRVFPFFRSREKPKNHGVGLPQNALCSKMEAYG
jgi:hypothetical protein